MRRAAPAASAAAIATAALVAVAGCTASGSGAAEDSATPATAVPATSEPGAHPADDGVRLVGSVAVPDGTQFQGTTVGGLSGIDYDPDTGHYVVISDDKGEGGPA